MSFLLTTAGFRDIVLRDMATAYEDTYLIYLD